MTVRSRHGGASIEHGRPRTTAVGKGVGRVVPMRVERLIEGSAQAPRTTRFTVAEMDSVLGWRSAMRLVASELTMNAWEHAHAPDARPIPLALEHRDGGLRMEVHDQGPGFDAPVEPDPRPPDEPGWGLRIVRSLADAWGVSSSRDGTCVWVLRARFEPDTA